MTLYNHLVLANHLTQATMLIQFKNRLFAVFCGVLRCFHFNKTLTAGIS